MSRGTRASGSRLLLGAALALAMLCMLAHCADASQVTVRTEADESTELAEFVALVLWTWIQSCAPCFRIFSIHQRQ